MTRTNRADESQSSLETTGQMHPLTGPDRVLEAAEPAKKAALYVSLGLTLTYKPSKRRVLVRSGSRRCTSGVG